MAVGDAYIGMFPAFLTPLLTQLFFPKPPTCFCRGERRKYAGKNSRLNGGSNSQPPGHESDTLTTEPPGRVGNRASDFGHGLMTEIPRNDTAAGSEEQDRAARMCRRILLLLSVNLASSRIRVYSLLIFLNPVQHIPLPTSRRKMRLKTICAFFAVWSCPNAVCQN